MSKSDSGGVKMDFIAQLTAEHQDYTAKLSTLAEVIEGIRINGRGDYFTSTLDDLLAVFTVDLDNHARREEDILFPRLLQMVPESPIPVMVLEHQTIREHSAAFERGYKAWRAGQDEAFRDWAKSALDLRGAFSTHMQKENLILFPMARRVLQPDEIAKWLER